MSAQYEIVEDYKPSWRPMHPVTCAERDLMLRELRMLGINGPDQELNTVGQILGHPCQALDSIRWSDARKVIEHCQRVRRRRY